MSTGEKGGKSESQVARGESGSSITCVTKTIGRMRNVMTGNCACCASSSVLHIAPTAAYKPAYMKKPKVKKPTKSSNNPRPGNMSDMLSSPTRSGRVASSMGIPAPTASAPSASRSRARLGMRKAATKAS